MQEIERQIITKLISDLLAAGFAISVNDGEETVVQRSTDSEEIHKALGSTDEDHLYIHIPGNLKSAWVHLVYGNDAAVICNYNVSLEPHLAGANALAEELDR